VRRCAAIAGRWLVPCLLVGACGAPRPSQSTTTTGETGEADGDGDVDVEAGEDTASLPCELEVAALVPFVSRTDGGCSVVVRLHHETRAQLGHQVTCARWSDDDLDEADARGRTDCCGSAGAALPRTDDAAPWVFHAPPDEAGAAGHVAVVSALVGERVLEASIARGDGMGELLVPEAWLGPGGIGSGCGLSPGPTPVGYDLVEGGPLATAHLEAAWAVVSTSALPAAMSVMSELRRVVVLRYPRRVDPFDASTAEYLVVLEGEAADGPAPED
jgi:hypothetical protein